MGLKLNGRYISLILAVQIGKWTAGRARGGRRAAGPEAPGGTDWPAVARGCGEAGKPPGMGAWLLGTGASRVGFAKKERERDSKCSPGSVCGGLFSGGAFPSFYKAHVRICFFLLGAPGLVRFGEMHCSLPCCKALF